MNVTETAQKHLGAFIFEMETCRKFAEDKIKTWRNQVWALSKVAQSEPHLSYLVYKRVFPSRWKHIQKFFGNVSDSMKPLEEEIFSFLEVITPPQNNCDTDIEKLLPYLSGMEDWGFEIRLNNAGNNSAIPIF